MYPAYTDIGTLHNSLRPDRRPVPRASEIELRVRRTIGRQAA